LKGALAESREKEGNRNEKEWKGAPKFTQGVVSGVGGKWEIEKRIEIVRGPGERKSKRL